MTPLLPLWLGTALAGPYLQPTDPWQECLDDVVEVVDTRPEDPLGEALVVGVACHHDPGIAPLAYADDDAAAMTAALTERGYAVTVLTGEVTAARFDTVLRGMLSRKPEEVVVYFSGHGVLADTPRGVQRHLVFSDTSLDALATTSMSATVLEAGLSALPADHRVLIQDTCFAANADGGKSLGGPEGAKGMLLQAPPTTAGDLRLYASRFYQLAVEEPELGGSLYTQTLLESLQQPTSDHDGDGCVGLWEAHQTAKEAVHSTRQGLQTPVSQRHGEVRGVGAGRCMPTTPTHGLFDQPADDLEVTLDGEPLTEVAVEPGRHQLRVLGRTGWSSPAVVLMDAPVQVSSGRWFDLEEELDRRRPGALVEMGLSAHPGALAVPRFGATSGLWYLGRQRHAHRWAVGLVVGVQPPQPIADIRYLAGSAHVRAATLWSVGPVQLGPALSAGVHGRTPSPPEVPTVRFPTQWAPGVEIGMRGQVQARWAAVSLDAGLAALPLDGRLSVWPRLGVSVGVAP